MFLNFLDIQCWFRFFYKIYDFHFFKMSSFKILRAFKTETFIIL